MTEKLLTTKQVAEIFGVQVMVIYDLIAKKILRPIKLNQRLYRFTQTEVDRVIRDWQEKEYAVPVGGNDHDGSTDEDSQG